MYNNLQSRLHFLFIYLCIYVYIHTLFKESLDEIYKIGMVQFFKIDPRWVFSTSTFRLVCHVTLESLWNTKGLGKNLVPDKPLRKWGSMLTSGIFRRGSLFSSVDKQGLELLSSSSEEQRSTKITGLAEVLGRLAGPGLEDDLWLNTGNTDWWAFGAGVKVGGGL